MAMKQSRKNSQEIKNEILSQLDKQPLSVEQLRKKIKDSNWSTINKYLEELKEEEQVREIISTDKIKIYQRIVGDTYFDIPITEKQRKKFKTLFSMIIEKYKEEKGEIPTKTHVAKCAVNAIDNEDELSDLPIVWYLYGKMPLMNINPNLEYSREFNFEKEKRIQNLISAFVEENKRKNALKVQRDQHKEYRENLYEIYDEIVKCLNQPGKDNNKEIVDLISKFFIACPVDPEFPEIFDLTEKVVSLIQKIDNIGLNIQEYRREIFLTFDYLWKLIALYKLYKSIKRENSCLNKQTLLNFHLGGALEDRKRMLKESISDLETIYLNKLRDYNVEEMGLSQEAKEASKIMEDWTGKE